MLTFDDLIERFTDWATTTDDVRAAVIIGSRARTDHPADEWSDLDVLVFTRHPDQFIQSSDWTANIASVWLTFIERSADGRSWERRILFAGGLDVDVALNPVEVLASIAQDIPLEVSDMIRRGVRVLVDKDGALTQILKIPLPTMPLFQKPSPQKFLNAVNDFWYHTLWSAKHLRRGELWWAKSGVDSYLKTLLQQMLEWHAHAMRGDQYDTWLRGRFLEEWADPRAVEQLRHTFAHYDEQDIANALRATMNLYRWLEDETAARWNFAMPKNAEHQTANTVQRLLEFELLRKQDLK